MQILSEKGVRVAARIAAVAGISDAPMDWADPQLDAISAQGLPCVDADAAARMAEAIRNARSAGDSVGGVVECFATGLPAGLGAPMFDGVENRIARALFGIPAVKGVEFGAGFQAASMRGSAHNDPFRIADGRVVTETNRHGGALGGITTGMPLVVRAAFKPTPSIALAQRSVSLGRGEDATLCVKGRHDSCVVVRAVPVVEAAVACVILDMLLDEEGR